MTQTNINIFDIVVNNNVKTTKGLLSKFLNAIKDRIPKRNVTRVANNIVKMYNSLPEEQLFKSVFRITDADLNFEVVSSRQKEYYSANTKFDLMSEFDKLVELISSLYSEPKEKVIEITIELPKPKTPKLIKTVSYEKVTILERWVKIGYKMYKRQFDFLSGLEYINVDGDIYWIKSTRNGQLYLSE